MPPFIKTTCPECHRRVTIDLEELKKNSQVIYRDDATGRKTRTHEYVVTCPHCGHRFKIQIPETE